MRWCLSVRHRLDSFSSSMANPIHYGRNKKLSDDDQSQTGQKGENRSDVLDNTAGLT